MYLDCSIDVKNMHPQWIGGVKAVGNNLNIKSLPKQLPLFYKHCFAATNRRVLEGKYGDEINWREICFNIYKTSTDTYSRMFQYKIVHDIFPVYYMLYKWKARTLTSADIAF